MEIADKFAKMQVKWSAVDTSLKISGVAVSEMQKKYQEFIKDPSKMKWNEYITKVSRESLVEQLKKADDEIKDCMKIRDDCMTLLSDMHQNITKIGFEGQQEYNTNQQYIENLEREQQETVKQREQVYAEKLTVDQTF